MRPVRRNTHRSSRKWAARWKSAAEQGQADVIIIGNNSASEAADTESATDLDRLRKSVAGLAPSGRGPVWVVLIGHGTFDGREAKFNLTGPDLGVEDLKSMLARFERPIAVVNCTSASGAFLKGLSAKGRAVVTATRSGDEINFARFGDYMSQAIADPAADLDKDDQVSLLEAFLTASKRAEEFYKSDGRLATEHALIDDNGDGLGTPADWFRGVRATKRAKDGAELDGAARDSCTSCRMNASSNCQPMPAPDATNSSSPWNNCAIRKRSSPKTNTIDS